MMLALNWLLSSHLFISNNSGATLDKYFKENFCIMKNIEKEF